MARRNIPPVEFLWPSSVAEAVSMLAGSPQEVRIIAGGVDLVGELRVGVLPQPPKKLVNIKRITPAMDYITEDTGGLKIGALTRISAIAADPKTQKYTALLRASKILATPQLRNMGTIGGTICQHTRCWFFRSQFNVCLRKDPSKPCYAVAGDNRYHSIFGGINGCFAVNPSDLAPTLVALGAIVKTSKRTLDANDFFGAGVFGVDGERTTVLANNELVTEIQIPAPVSGAKSAFIKVAKRKALDFPMVNCAAAITSQGGAVTAARICIGAVYNKPYLATKGGEALIGKPINEANADAAATAAISGNVTLPFNKWKVEMAKGVVKKAILACA